MQTIKRVKARGIVTQPVTYLTYLKAGTKETTIVDCIKCNIASVMSLMASRRIEPIYDDAEELLLRWEKLPIDQQLKIFALTSNLPARINASSLPDQRPQLLLEYLSSL
ncbi:MAG: hypothetical protein KGS72_26990 [Cyanobacteria bacterium REEB67]|nr:hypothetical protein [Cyanobacteria bacterium REEB67]